MALAQGPRRLVAGNWKMNGAGPALKEAQALARTLEREPARCRVALFPPALLIHRMAERLAGGPVEVGGQDTHAERFGAFTGDHSAEMLHDAGATLVIVGHSERRAGYGECDKVVAAKVKAALRAGLEPVICVGESLQEREGGRALQVVAAQIATSLPAALDGRAFAVAYEPVWAIGTGLTPTVEDIEAMHGRIRELLAARFSNAAAVPVLYGGSVKPANAVELMSARGVDGALVGGASLKAADFLPIVRAA